MTSNLPTLKVLIVVVRVLWLLVLFESKCSIDAFFPWNQQQQQHSTTRSFSLGASKENVGEILVSRPSGNSYRLAYRLVRPMSLSSKTAAPIVVLHGGPSLPSDYLYPLEHVVPYRSILYYDQIGCGRSDEPQQMSDYSIEYALNDLETLITKFGLQRFHLYGQSFGGILAFEYMKRMAERRDSHQGGVLSTILSSTPTSVALVESEVNHLLSTLQSSSSSLDDSTLMEQFHLNHQCRISNQPQPLVDAYAHAGSVWRGTTAISDYQATLPNKGSARMPSCMVMRGEHDFVTQTCIDGWKQCFNHNYVRSKVMDGCSHHGLLEQGALYGNIVDMYFAEYD
jgi:proline iminopeptidase